MMIKLLIIFTILLDGLYVDRDTELLSKIITAECSVCSVREQYLVGSVVLNRVDHHRFPNTISAVIEQPRQFDGRTSHWFITTPKTLRVAKDLLEGRGRDKDVYYFYRRDSPNKTFLRNMQKYLVHTEEFHNFATLEH